MKLKLFRNALLLVLFLNSPNLWSATFDVDSTVDFVDLNIGDGVCKTELGTCTLRAAIQESNVSADLDTINLPAGTYTLNYGQAGENAAAEGDLDVTGYVAIVGAGSDTTIIDGNATDRIFDFKDVPSNQQPQDKPWNSITHLTLKNGNVLKESGGAILNYSRLSIDDVIFDNNQANNTSPGTYGYGNGGAIYSQWGSTVKLTIRNTTFKNNSTNGVAGALFVQESADVFDSIFETNSAYQAGAIRGAVNLTNVKINSNTATTYGGGMYGEGNIKNTQFEKNTAANGGGLYLINISNLHNVLVYDNSATASGGGIYFGSTCCTQAMEYVLSNITISNNTSEATGGGVYSATAQSAEFTNATIYKNTANSTTETNPGGNIFGNVRIRNSIVAGAQNGGNCSEIQSSLGFNIDDGNSCGFTVIKDQTNTDPLLDALSTTGSFDRTYAPLPSSPAIDNGSITFCPEVDQRVFVRLNGNCDIGAHEVDAAKVNSGEVSFIQSTFEVNEADSTGKVTLQRANGAMGRVVAHYVVSDHGTEALKAYETDTYYSIGLMSSGGTVIWEDGDTSDKEVSFEVSSHTFSSSSSAHYFTMKISESSETSTIVEPAEARVNVTHVLTQSSTSGSKGYFSTIYSSEMSNESDEKIVVTVKRTGGSQGVASAKYATSALFVKDGQDYTDVSGEIVWQDGEDGEKTIEIPVVNNQTFDGKRYIELAFTDITGFTYSYDNQSMNIEILDDETGDYGKLIFESNSFIVNETQATASIRVMRTGSTVGKAFVKVSAYTSSREILPSATKENDFKFEPVDLIFEDGEAEKTISITIINDQLPEDLESFLIGLSNAEGTASLDWYNREAVITIMDDDTTYTGPYNIDLDKLAENIGAQYFQGDKGETGDKGPVGDKGPTGDKGPDGDAAPDTQVNANVDTSKESSSKKTSRLAVGDELYSLMLVLLVSRLLYRRRQKGLLFGK